LSGLFSKVSGSATAIVLSKNNELKMNLNIKPPCVFYLLNISIPYFNRRFEMQKTLCLYDTNSSLARLFEIEGDYSHLNGVFINDLDSDRDLVKELTSLLFDDEGDYKVNFIKTPTKDWDHFIHVGMMD
jgi:hypothetical protein